MASVLAMMKKLEINTPAKGVGSIALDSGVGLGASYAIGQVYSRFSDKWYGKRAPYIFAAGGKLAALGLSLMAGGNQTFVGNMFNSIGQAGINAIGLEMGLRHGRKATGKQAVLLPAGASLPAGATAMGALGEAPAGRGLSWDQIQELASGR